MLEPQISKRNGNVGWLDGARPTRRPRSWPIWKASDVPKWNGCLMLWTSSLQSGCVRISAERQAITRPQTSSMSACGQTRSVRVNPGKTMIACCLKTLWVFCS